MRRFAFVFSPSALPFDRHSRHPAASRPPSHRHAALPTIRRAVLPRTAPRMALSVQTETLPKSQCSLEISVGSEECTAAWDSVVAELVKKSSVDGFRKGSAPKQIVVNQYGKDRVRAAACEEVIEKSVKKAIEKSGLTVIGQAQFDMEDGGVEKIIADYDPKSSLSFKVKVDVWPDVSFSSSYEGMEVEAEKATLEESLVDNALEELRKKESFSILSPEGTTAALGKNVVADMIGYYCQENGSKGNKLPEIADGKSVEINMIEGRYMIGFVEGLVGAAVGETRDVKVEFPSNNPRPELAGLKAIFEVTVHAIKDVVLPDLDDSFAMKVSEEKNIEGLRDAIRLRLDTEAEAEQNKNINASIETKLAEVAVLDVPETLIEDQAKNKFANMIASFKDKGMPDETVKAMVTKDNFNLYKERNLPKIEKSLRVNFAVSKIAKDNNLTVDKQVLEDQMALVKAELKGEEVEEDKVRDNIEAQLEREMVFDLIKKTAVITIVPKKEDDEAAVEATASAPASA